MHEEKLLNIGEGERRELREGDHWRPVTAIRETPIGPFNRITRKEDPYSMKVGDSKLERCAVEMPDRM